MTSLMNEEAFIHVTFMQENSGIPNGFFLEIDGVYRSGRAHQAGEKEGVEPIARSGVEAGVARANRLGQTTMDFLDQPSSFTIPPAFPRANKSKPQSIFRT